MFDAHLHVFDPAYALTPNEGWLPEPFTVADYRARVAHLGVTGGAVVAASVQGADQDGLLAALRALGPAFAGVAQLPAGVPDEEILRLDRAGVRAVRFNLRRGGPAGIEALEELALRVHRLAGWHVELYVDGRELPALEERLAALPRVVVDHLGLRPEGLPVLRRLVTHNTVVKASGFGRLEMDAGAALRLLAAANPAALVVGTDLPGTRAPRPFADADLALVRRVLGAQEQRLALEDNAVALYRPAGFAEP